MIFIVTFIIRYGLHQQIPNVMMRKRNAPQEAKTATDLGFNQSLHALPSKNTNSNYRIFTDP